MPVTTTLRNTVVETGETETTFQAGLVGVPFRFLKPLLEVTLAGAGKVPVDPISSGEPNFWITARETGAFLRASIGHDDLGDALLLEMTLRPPDEDGAPAAMQTSIGGIEHALSLGWIDPDVVDDLATLVDKIQRCIAWTWLEMKGYAEPLPLESGAATDLDFILSTSPGDMIYSIGENEDEQSELVFLIAASAQDLAALPQDPPVNVQATLYHVNGVLLVPLVVQIGDVYYGTWINAWNEHRDGLRSLDLLASQDRLTFAFYQPATGAEPRRVIEVANTLDASDIRRAFDNAPTWTMEQFDAARATLDTRFPTPQALFEHGSDG